MKWLIALMFIIAIPLVVAEDFFDWHGTAQGSSANTDVCAGVFFNVTDTINLTGLERKATDTADEWFLYNQTTGLGCTGGVKSGTWGASELRANISGGVTLNPGETWVWLTDSGGATYSMKYGSGSALPTTGNSSGTTFNWMGGVDPPLTIPDDGNVRNVYGFYYSTFEEPPAPTPSTITKEDLYFGLQGTNVTITSGAYVSLFTDTLNITNTTQLAFKAQIPIFSPGTSTTQCRILYDGSNEGSASRTNTAGQWGSLSFGTGVINETAGLYDVSLQCRRVGPGNFDVVNTSITGFDNQVNISMAVLDSYTLPSTLQPVLNYTYTTGIAGPNESTNLLLHVDTEQSVTYSSDGYVQTMIEVGTKNCTVADRYGASGSTGSLGNSCVFNATNDTSYNVRIWSNGPATTDIELTLHEMIVGWDEHNEVSLSGDTIPASNGIITSYKVNVSDTGNAIFTEVTASVNGTGTATLYTNITGPTGGVGHMTKRTVSGNNGVLTNRYVYQSLTAGEYTVYLWGDCGGVTCDLDGADFMSYVGETIDQQAQVFTVTAEDLFDDSSISEFTVEYLSANFTTSSGSLDLASFVNLTDVKIYKDDFFSQTVEDHNTTFDIQFNISQGYLENYTFFDILGDQVVPSSLNVSVSGGKTYTSVVNGTPVYLTNGSNSVTYSATGYYDDTESTTLTPTQVLEKTVTGLYDNEYTIGANYNGAGIQNFTVFMNYSAYNSTWIVQTGAAVIPTIQGNTYTFTINATGYAIANISLPSNASTHLYNFSLFQAQTLNLTIREEITREILDNDTFEIEVISNLTAGNYTTSNGTLFLELLDPADYIIRYRSANYPERDYILTLTSQSYNAITLYALNFTESSDVLVDVKDSEGNAVEGAVVKLLRYYPYCNCYEAVEMSQTGFSGNAYFNGQYYEGHYKWAVDYLGVNYFLSSSPENLVPGQGETIVTRTITINLGANPYEVFTTLSSVGYTCTYNNDTGGLSMTWSGGVVSRGCIDAEFVNGTQYQSVGANCLSAGAGSVNLNLDTNTTYKYRGYVTIEGVDHNVCAAHINPPSFDMGDLGTFLSLGLLITLVIAFSFSAIGVLIISVIGVLAIAYLGTFTFTTTFIAGFAVLVLGLGIYVMRS